jgi:sigma-B regulation protein RsbU (phosphoserine phosphatase)
VWLNVRESQDSPHPIPDGRSPSHPPEVEAARRVQQRLFPEPLPAVPGWDCAAVCRPARVVAGDYYDLFAEAPGRLALALGDVAGKGLGPALVMAGLHALVRSRLPGRADGLAGLAAEVNRYLLATTPDDMFVTLFLAVIDLAGGRLRYVNAGHPPPVVVSPHGDEPVCLAEGGAVLGILPDASYDEGEAVLGPGSVLVLYSDGLTEAAGGDGGLFGAKGVIDVLRATRSAPAGAVLARLLGAATDFTAGAGPADDLSVVILRRLPGPVEGTAPGGRS